MRLIPSLCVATLLLAGCTSFSQEECTNGEWETIGTEDAMLGHPSSRFIDHQNMCRRYKITPNQSNYIRGYQTGLTAYCTPGNGFAVGRNGYQYKGICHKGMEAGFISGYIRGGRLHEIETSIATIERKLSIIKQQILAFNRSGISRNHKKLSKLRSEAKSLSAKIERLTFDRGRALVEADRFLQSAASDV